MAWTKRELEGVNEELTLEIRRLRAENECLRSLLVSASEQYRQLTERTERLERRYRRLKELLITSLGESASETTGDADAARA